MNELPRLLADLDPAPGRIRVDVDDFAVDEIPLYEFDGAGTHTFFQIEKRGISTMHAVGEIARALGVRRFDVGYAGLKDSRAVTRQWMSVEHVPPDRVRELQLPRIVVLRVTQHRNKLKIGHLRGNRFALRVRDTSVDRLGELRAGLERLSALGVPNYFGEQRFGGRGDSWLTGAAILREDLAGALDYVLGKPGDRDRGAILKARQLYEAGKYAEAARQWPGVFRDERRALKTLAGRRGTKKRAMLAIDQSMRRFYVSAYQSHVFNAVLAERIEQRRWRLEVGDLAWIHRSGAVFRVESDDEQPRFDAFEISPTGPMFGYRMSAPGGAAGESEQRVLSAEGLTIEQFHSPRLRLKGGRRPLRFRAEDAQIELGADPRGAYLALGFSLSAGCYATSLLRELFALRTEAAGEPDRESDDQGD